MSRRVTLNGQVFADLTRPQPEAGEVAASRVIVALCQQAQRLLQTPVVKLVGFERRVVDWTLELELTFEEATEWQDSATTGASAMIAGGFEQT